MSSRYARHASGDWRANSNGNWVLIEGGVLQATVYATEDGLWGAIWNGARDGKARLLKEKRDSADDACQAVESAIEEGEGSLKWWPTNDTWNPRKGGGCYRRSNGSIISVKQAKSKSWFVVNSSGGFLGRAGRTAWFAAEEEARGAADALVARSGDWSWVSPS